ncbi:SH3 domain-containing protein [Cupriavidus sp. 30B13]|uniref:SH3 domain-containing protein n=1 Tax=Cupriavidus sp. 30B13 TaxID=3384241 RepID=UPI003B9130BB
MTDNQNASSTETVIGLRIREQATSKSTILGILQRGARIAVTERSKDGKWGRSTNSSKVPSSL